MGVAVLEAFISLFLPRYPGVYLSRRVRLFPGASQGWSWRTIVGLHFPSFLCASLQMRFHRLENGPKEEELHEEDGWDPPCWAKKERRKKETRWVSGKIADMLAQLNVAHTSKQTGSLEDLLLLPHMSAAWSEYIFGKYWWKGDYGCFCPFYSWNHETVEGSMSYSVQLAKQTTSSTHPGIQ